MSEKKYQTIVIEYEGDEPPLKGFGVPVLGCEVTAISMGDDFHKACLLEDTIEKLKSMIDNGLGWEDVEQDSLQSHIN